MTKKTFLKLRKMILSADNEMSDLGITTYLRKVGAEDNFGMRMMTYAAFQSLPEEEALLKLFADDRNTNEKTGKNGKK